MKTWRKEIQKWMDKHKKSRISITPSSYNLILPYMVESAIDHSIPLGYIKDQCIIDPSHED